MYDRAHVATWHRHEDGSYQAEYKGWSLTVTWKPEPPQGGPYGFLWKAQAPDQGGVIHSPELLEEMEGAMMQAEAVATERS